MKKFILVLTILLFSQISFSQKKHALALELYRPIQSTTSWGFYNEYMAFGSATSYSTTTSRAYFSNALGVSYEYSIKPDLIIRPRIGVTFRNLSEERDGFDDGIYVKESYDYKQKHFNAFLGLAKRINLFKNFDIDLGIDFCASYYQSAHADLARGAFFKDSIAPALTEIQHTDDPTMLITGAGFYLKPEYTF